MLRHWQLAAAVLWGVLAAGILLRDWLIPDDVLARLPVRNWTLATVICGCLAVWNIARWMSARAARERFSVREAMRSPSGTPRGYEYNPDLDFQRMDREKSGGDSGNGRDASPIS